MAPILAQVGPLTLYTHDVFTVAGILAGLAIYYRALRRDDVLDGRIVLISIAAIAGGALGARLLTSWEVIDEVRAADPDHATACGLIGPVAYRELTQRHARPTIPDVVLQ